MCYYLVSDIDYWLCVDWRNKEAETLEVSVMSISALVDGDRNSRVPYSDPLVVVVGCEYEVDAGNIVIFFWT